MGVGGAQVTPQHCGVMTSCPGPHIVSEEGASDPIFSQRIGEGRARQLAKDLKRFRYLLKDLCLSKNHDEFSSQRDLQEQEGMKKGQEFLPSGIYCTKPSSA